MDACLILWMAAPGHGAGVRAAPAIGRPDDGKEGAGRHKV
jgi:hypothetical protein